MPGDLMLPVSEEERRQNRGMGIDWIGLCHTFFV